MIVHQLNHSLARSLTRSLVSRGMRGDRGVARPPRQGEERREKRGERRTNTEERGGRREERRENTEDRRAAQSADDPKAEEPKIALSGDVDDPPDPREDLRFSIVPQRPRVLPPSRRGSADGLLVPLAHVLMRTPCDE